MSSLSLSRPARKSRGQSKKGCLPCKTRHVKCDEVHPICNNCSRRQDACTWRDDSNALFVLPCAARVALKPSKDHQLSILPSRNFRPKELELLHKWTTDTLFTFIPGLPNVHDTFRITLPQIAFKTECLLHAVFAVTSLHMHHLFPASDYLQRAKMYCQHAVLGHFNTPTDLTCLDTSVMTDMLLAMYWLALPTWEPTDFNILPNVFNWLPPMRTFLGRIDFYRQQLAKDSPLPPIIAPLLLDYDITSSLTPFSNLFLKIYHPEVCPFDIEELGDAQTIAAYEAAVLTVLNCTWGSFMTPGIQTFAIYGFPVMVPDDFFKLFLEKRPRALIIVAHYCSILGQFEGVWWYSWERYRHDLQHILSLLDDKWLPFLEYPRNVLVMKEQQLSHAFNAPVDSNSMVEANISADYDGSSLGLLEPFGSSHAWL